MKTFTYAFIIIVIFTSISCRSVEKMVDEGRYDDAIQFSAKKLSGKANGKLKYVKGLEEAFSKVNSRDLDKIQLLKSKSDPSLWDEVYRIAIRIENRQNSILPFLPLISKEGYRAHFSFEDTNALLLEAGTHAASYHYERAKKLLHSAEKEKNKKEARNAYDELSRISKYFKEYKDVDELMDRSHQLGTIHVLVKWDNLDEHRLPARITNSMDELLITHLDKYWIKYYSKEDKTSDIDFICNLKINNIDISPEREMIDRTRESNSVERWVDVVNKDGIVKDSLGNPVKTKIVDEYNAQVVKITRTKSARIIGMLELRDYATGKLVEKKIQEIEIEFRNESCTFTGDKKALSGDSLRLLDKQWEAFPTDYAMIEEGLNKLGRSFENAIRSFNL